MKNPSSGECAGKRLSNTLHYIVNNADDDIENISLLLAVPLLRSHKSSILCNRCRRTHLCILHFGPDRRFLATFYYTMSFTFHSGIVSPQLLWWFVRLLQEIYMQKFCAIFGLNIMLILSTCLFLSRIYLVFRSPFLFSHSIELGEKFSLIHTLVVSVCVRLRSSKASRCDVLISARNNSLYSL